MARSVSILGATGSIGRSTLDLIEREGDAFDVVALTAHSDVEGLAAAARRTRARHAVIGDERLYPALKNALAGTGTQAAAGNEAICEAAALGADWTMAAIVGTAGLKPVMAALRQGKTVALANKESRKRRGRRCCRSIPNIMRSSNAFRTKIPPASGASFSPRAAVRSGR